jgi:hypothetical protein
VAFYAARICSSGGRRMKKTFEIESNDVFKDGKYRYLPIPERVHKIFHLWADHSLECVGMKQWSERCWQVRLKGKKKDIQKFVYEFTVLHSDAYSIRETTWF